MLGSGGPDLPDQKGRRVIVWPEHVAEAKFLPVPKWEGRAKK